MENTRITRILCLCSSTVVYILGFNLFSSMVIYFLGFRFKKEAKIRKIIMKPYEGLKSWSLHFGLNGFTHELIGPQTSKILLMTWGQATKQKNAQIFHY